jgi:nucleoid DNA-binding protein
MSLGKRDIVKNISAEAHLTNQISSEILNCFISLIKSNSVSKTIKISNFGSFYYKKTPRRIGRNPKTKEEFKIPASEKLAFKASNKVKSILN